MLKLYTYQKCSTCRDAVQWLKDRGIAFREIPIRETPPSVTELKAMLNARGSLTKICNTSGMDYRALGLAVKLPGMTPEAVIALLSGNGNLIKRPFALDPERSIYLTGFKKAEWEASLSATPG